MLGVRADAAGAQPGEPPLRPHDADVTGGYYQPVRAVATLDGDTLSPGIGLTRITCDLANAPFDIVVEFQARYHANHNPTLVGVMPWARTASLAARASTSDPATSPPRCRPGPR